MSRPWRQEDVDRHYTRFTTRVHDEETLEHMVAPIIKRFAAEGHRTAVVTEKPEEDYVIHCIAVRLLKGEIPKAISDKLEPKTLDDLKTLTVQEATMEPLGIHFGPPKY